jgi:plastocyanin
MGIRKSLLITAVVLAVLALAACSTTSDATTTTTAAGATTTTTAGTTTTADSSTTVTIQNFAFEPGTLTVTVGTTVTWVNNDGTTHTVTADGGTFDSGSLAAGETFQFTFDQVGDFTYHCSIHSTMQGTISVKGRA